MKRLNKRDLLKLKLPSRPAGMEEKITFGAKLASCAGQRVLLVSLFLPDCTDAWLTIYLAKQDYTTRMWAGEESGWKEAGLENILVPDPLTRRRDGKTTLPWLPKELLAVDVEAANRAQRFMHSDPRKPLVWQIYRFQAAIREARRLERAEKKTAGLARLLAVDLPTPRGMEQDMQRRELDTDRYLIYRRWGETRAEAYCTSCNSAVELAGQPVHKGNAICPHCGKECVTLAAGRGRDHLWQQGAYCLAQLLPADNEAPGLVLREFYVTRGFGGEPPYPIRWEERARYLFDGEKALRLLPETIWEHTDKLYDRCVVRWKPAAKCKESINGYAFDTGFWDTVEKSCMRYSCLMDYMQKNKRWHDPIGWLTLYTKHPQVEKLVKEGFWYLAQEEVEYGPNVKRGSCIDWNEKTVPGMLGMNRAELAAVKERWSEGGRTAHVIRSVKRYRDAGLAITKENLRLQDKIGYHDAFFLARAKEYGMNQCLKYLRAQGRKSGKDLGWLVQTWSDIYRMAQSEKVKITRAKAFAPDMAALHDELQALQQERLQRQREKEAEERIKQTAKEREAMAFRALVLAPLAWQEGEYLIRPAGSPEEIIREGVELDHCVGGYTHRHAEGATNIFFVRRAAQPEKPFVTVELDLKKHRIVQQHGYQNERSASFDPAVAAFTEKWLEQVVKPVDEAQLIKRARAEQKKAAKPAGTMMKNKKAPHGQAHSPAA